MRVNIDTAPTPWRTFTTGGMPVIVDAKGRTVATLSEFRGDANAKLIVNAVNSSASKPAYNRETLVTIITGCICKHVQAPMVQNRVIEAAEEIADKYCELSIVQQRDALLEAVKYAADVFSHYAELHKAKGAKEKANSNYEHCRVMLDAITSVTGGTA